MADIPKSFDEFSKRDDRTRAAAHGGWSPEQARSFFPVVSPGQYVPASNPGMAAQPEIVSRPTYFPSKQQQPDISWPEFSRRDDFNPRRSRP